MAILPCEAEHWIQTKSCARIGISSKCHSNKMRELELGFQCEIQKMTMTEERKKLSERLPIRASDPRPVPDPMKRRRFRTHGIDEGEGIFFAADDASWLSPSLEPLYIFLLIRFQSRREFNLLLNAISSNLIVSQDWRECAERAGFSRERASERALSSFLLLPYSHGE
ncbi:hypothetical protein ACLOJK_026089 [Asimina triloba]